LRPDSHAVTGVDPSLRLSAQRALLGAITPEIRLIKVRKDGAQITFTTIIAQPLGEEAEEALSIAATEIAADFPECQIREHLFVSAEDLPREGQLDEGWVYQRLEVR
jgi:hypothetical protein